MKYWYKGGSFKVFPNLEIYYNEDEELVYFSLVWMKFEIELPICIKWKNKNETEI